MKNVHLRKPTAMVREQIESAGYRWLSGEYQNNKSKLTLLCPKRHITNTMTWNNFKTGRRCRICARKEIGKHQRNSYQHII